MVRIDPHAIVSQTVPSLHGNRGLTGSGNRHKCVPQSHPPSPEYPSLCRDRKNAAGDLHHDPNIVLRFNRRTATIVRQDHGPHFPVTPPLPGRPYHQYEKPWTDFNISPPVPSNGGDPGHHSLVLDDRIGKGRHVEPTGQFSKTNHQSHHHKRRILYHILPNSTLCTG